MRLLLVWLMLSTYVQVNALNQYKVFTKEGRQGLISFDGHEIIPPVYDQIGWSVGEFQLVGNIVGYRENGKWGLININNKKLTETLYYQVSVLDSTHILAAIKGKFSNHLFYGLIDIKGELKVGCNYFTIESFVDDFKISKYDHGEIKYGLLDRSYNIKVPTIYKELKILNNYLIACKNFNNRWQIADFSGKIPNEQSYDTFELLIDGIKISINGKHGLIDATTGELIHNAQFKNVISSTDISKFPNWEIRAFNLEKIREITADSVIYNNFFITHANGNQEVIIDGEDLFQGKSVTIKKAESGYLVAKDLLTNMWMLITTSGDLIVDEKDSIHFDGLYFYTFSNEKWQIFNRFGRKISPWDYSSVLESVCNLIPVNRDKYWGFLDFQGNQPFHQKYDDVGTGADNMICVKYIGKWGVTDLFGDWVIKPAYDTIFVVSDGFIASVGSEKHLFSKGGRTLFATTGDLRDQGDYLTLHDEEMVGAVSFNGEFIVDPIYESVQKLGDLYLAKSLSNAVLINGDGKFVMSFDDNVSDILGYSEGYYGIKKDGSYGFVNENGKLRIANRYESVKLFSEGFAAVKLNDKWGFVNEDEDLIIQPLYEEVSNFINGLSIVKQNEKYGLVNKFGKEVIKPKYSRIELTKNQGYLLFLSENEVGVADSNGNVVLQPNYLNITETSNGLLIVNKNNKVGIMNISGFIKVPFDYEEIREEGDYFILKVLPDK